MINILSGLAGKVLPEDGKIINELITK